MLTRCSFVGHLEVRNAYNAKKPVKDTSMSKELARTVISYTAKNGDDKVRSITVPFAFGVPMDAAPTFTWVTGGGCDATASLTCRFDTRSAGKGRSRMRRRPLSLPTRCLSGLT